MPLSHQAQEIQETCMPTDPPHRMWVAQCEATATIKTRYGISSAFDYLVAEKLVNFAKAARQHPEFARERRSLSPR
jgi:hypothetical protein